MELTATWGSVTLCDSSAGDIANDWRGPSGVPQTQQKTALRRAAAGLFNRRNVQHTLSFTVTRPPFASPAEAAQFTADHAIALQAEDSNPAFEFSIGDKDYEMHEAVVVGREVSLLFGTTVVYSYTVVGGEIEDVTPP